MSPFAVFGLHIQPPAFDVIRALLAHVWSSDDSMTMLRQVDRALYVLWALIYGITVLIVFWWLSEMTGIAFATSSALFFSAHPAFIFYATLLETTLLSAFLILCFCYLLWRVKEGLFVPGAVLALSFLSLFFTRSIFQWQWLILLPLCLTLLHYPRRKMIVFITITTIVIGLHTVKQISLFGLTTTSSFTGLNLCKSIGVIGAWEHYKQESAPDEKASSAEPNVLSRVRKVNRSINYNNAYYLEVNRELLHQYRKQILSSSPRQLVKSYFLNLRIYLLPSSRYTIHVIVDRLPWRSAYDYIFSFPLLPLLLMTAALFWGARAKKSVFLRTIGLCLPVASIAAICILFERGENMRFKFFIEPILFVFLATQVYVSGTTMIKYVQTGAFKRQGQVR